MSKVPTTLVIIVAGMVLASSDARADDERVMLANGSVFEGQLVENVPSDHVTIKLATGEVRRFEWRDLASSYRERKPAPVVSGWPAANVTTPATAHVVVQSSSSGPVLMKNPGFDMTPLFAGQGLASISMMSDSGAPVPVCYAPCSADVDPRATYYVTGADVSRTRDFPIPEGRSTMRIHPGSRVMSTFGWVTLTAGLTAMLVGALWVPLSFIDYNTARGLSATQYAGIGVLAGGGVLSLLAIPFILAGNTHASINGIDVASGKIHIGPTGLAF